MRPENRTPGNSEFDEREECKAIDRECRERKCMFRILKSKLISCIILTIAIHSLEIEFPGSRKFIQREN
jgi:hypothetical protein